MFLMAIDDSSGAAYLGLLTVVIILAIIVPYLIKRTRSHVKAEFKPVREQWRDRENTSKMKHAADRVLVELVETSREISGRMDTKIRILNTLIRDAERHIKRLEELHNLPHIDLREESSAEEQAQEKIEEKVIVENKNVEIEKNDKAENENGDDNFNELPILPQGPPVDIAEDKSYLTEEKFSPPTENIPAGNDINKRVLTMLNQGYDIAEVARQAGISRQEVSLIQHLNSF